MPKRLALLLICAVALSVTSCGRARGPSRPSRTVPPPRSPAAKATGGPSYARPDRFTERKVTVGSGEWKLPGTLTVPKGRGPFPAVVLVHGSGPADRDETVGPNKPFRDLAWGLASRGIAVLRYDKRTLVYGLKIASMPRVTVKEETVDDALLAVSLLRRTKGIDLRRIFVLGHSLGGMLIPRIGKADPRIAGLIVMAGSTRPLEDVVLEQLSYIASLGGKQGKAVKAQIGMVRQLIARIKDPKLSENTPGLLLGAPAGYWLDLRGYDPAQAAKGLGQPMLILQGGRDYQVTKADYHRWESALSGRKDVGFRFYPSLNHLFIAGKGRITPAEYGRPGHISEAVVSDIAAWISRR